MSAKTYLRQILIGFGLLLLLVIASPFGVIGGVHLICDGAVAEGCGDLGILFVFFGVMPILLAILGFIAWTAFRRLRALELSTGYILLTCVLLIGCFHSILSAPGAAKTGFLWEIVPPPLLATIILAALCWVPEAPDRGATKPMLGNALLVVSILLIFRLAEAILYPLSFFSGVLSLSFALRKLAYLGPLKLIPNAVFILTFIALFLLTLRQWRTPQRETPIP